MFANVAASYDSFYGDTRTYDVIFKNGLRIGRQGRSFSADLEYVPFSWSGETGSFGENDLFWLST